MNFAGHQRKLRAPKITETQEHHTIASWYKKFGFVEPALAYHIRNERGSAWERMEAARMGIKVKIPDWGILDGKGGAGFIENKKRGWKATKARTGNYNAHEQAQLVLHEQLRRGGYWVEICETLEEWLEACRSHGVPIRSESITTERIRRGFENAMKDAAG